jgi:membrane-associated phospholipid phosphatase
MDIIQWFEEIDKGLFILIHSDAAVPAIDGVMKGLRHAFTWIPLYAFLLYWILRHGKKFAWQFILLSLVSFAITDYTSASILKPVLARTRPCYDPELQVYIRDLVGCGGQLSFPSSHAANHFGLAAFWFYAIYLIKGQRWYWLWIWALFIGYAQVYVGKHYPMDIVGGAMFGYVVGTLCAIIFEKWIYRPHPYLQKSFPDFNKYSH